MIIQIVGQPTSGKTTLLRSLTKYPVICVSLPRISSRVSNLQDTYRIHYRKLSEMVMELDSLGHIVVTDLSATTSTIVTAILSGETEIRPGLFVPDVVFKLPSLSIEETLHRMIARGQTSNRELATKYHIIGTLIDQCFNGQEATADEVKAFVLKQLSN